MLSGPGDPDELVFGGFLNLSGIMQARSCIMSTTHGLGINVVMRLMCLCEICAELLLSFYFLPTVGRLALQQVFFSKCFPLERTAISSYLIQAVLH